MRPESLPPPPFEKPDDDTEPPDDEDDDDDDEDVSDGGAELAVDVVDVVEGARSAETSRGRVCV